MSLVRSKMYTSPLPSVCPSRPVLLVGYNVVNGKKTPPLAGWVKSIPPKCYACLRSHAVFACHVGQRK